MCHHNRGLLLWVTRSVAVVADDDEKEIMVCMFEFAKDLINLQLTERELALICAVVLIDPSE